MVLGLKCWMIFINHFIHPTHNTGNIFNCKLFSLLVVFEIKNCFLKLYIYNVLLKHVLVRFRFTDLLRMLPTSIRKHSFEFPRKIKILVIFKNIDNF
jgi:hypothetical protein